MRVAIYYTPEREDPLHRAAAGWLGRSAFPGDEVRATDPTIGQWVSEPRRYGFHATLRAPFHLADGKTLDDVEAMVVALAADTDCVELGTLQLSATAGFLALAAPHAAPELAALEASVRERSELLRAALTTNEIARRKPGNLTASQRRNLHRWGYPNVGEDFRFHMTLTNGLGPDAPTDDLSRRAHEVFSGHLAMPRTLDALAIFVEDHPGAPLRVHAREPLQTPIRLARNL